MKLKLSDLSDEECDFIISDIAEMYKNYIFVAAEDIIRKAFDSIKMETLNGDDALHAACTIGFSVDVLLASLGEYRRYHRTNCEEENRREAPSYTIEYLKEIK